MNGEVKPTNAGILFFGKNPQRFVLQSQLSDVLQSFRERLDMITAVERVLIGINNKGRSGPCIYAMR